MASMNAEPKRVLILIEFQNDWLSSTGSINPQFQDREQLEASIANSAKALAEARRRNMEVIHVAMVLEPTYRMLVLNVRSLEASQVQVMAQRRRSRTLDLCR